ncbi:Sua5 family C-terminal domain-containing protein [Nannocystis radixulma]|uniref:Sua5 family C-terminal domain-containing protein n=1 Tax=Nannocystis radixulma TaxID=2995305 RepID=UPI00358DA4DB
MLSGQDHEAMSRSPGLRHRHYAPRARVVLVAPGQAAARGGEAVAVMSQSPCPPGFVGRWRLMPGDSRGLRAGAVRGAARARRAGGRDDRGRDGAGGRARPGESPTACGARAEG